MAQGAAAMRNGTPMRLVSPAPVLVQPAQAAAAAGRQTQAAAAAAAAASLYTNTPQSIYGTANVNTSVNGGTLGGKYPQNTRCSPISKRSFGDGFTAHY